MAYDASKALPVPAPRLSEPSEIELLDLDSFEVLDDDTSGPQPR